VRLQNGWIPVGGSESETGMPETREMQRYRVKWGPGYTKVNYKYKGSRMCVLPNHIYSLLEKANTKP